MLLDDSVITLPLVGPSYAKRLKKLEIETVNDLLHHVPSRYLDFRTTKNIKDLKIGDISTAQGEIMSLKNQYTRSGKKIQIAEFADQTGKINIVWFNQPYLIRILKEGSILSVAGEVKWFGRKKAFISPEYEIRNIGTNTGRLIPIYPETKGISSKWLRGKIKFAFDNLHKNINEYLPAKTLAELNLVDLEKAIKYVHFPKDLNQAQKGRERLAFNEILFYQMKSVKQKRDWQKNSTFHQLKINKKPINELIKSLPFKLTDSQTKAINEILEDLSKQTPMNRLLEGDVGSGKTVVAAIACFASFINGYQSIIMAPTQILANQHFNTLKSMFKKYKIKISLITSAKSKTDYKKTDLFVGTHSLIHKKVDFDNVAVVVIDEQHRFGVKQRAKLIKKSKNKRRAPHVLTMTATPIPRTIALTAYGDLDLSTLNELPKGRKPITTWLVPPKKREAAFRWVKSEIKKHSTQAFVVCPLIEESLTETMKSVKAATTEYEDLKNTFKSLKIGLMHGRQKNKEKENIIKKFKENKINILVTTPVVEVGIDIPNASIMIIEAAERFGLAQLHQLRGRVGRGEKRSYCLLFTEKSSRKSLARLDALKKEASGFRLAEIDLKLRGPGEIYGLKQHGFPELRIASWNDLDLIRKAKRTAENAFKQPDAFKKLLKFMFKDIALN